MIRIAFTLIGGKTWTGGYNYLLNLLRVLSIHKRNEITPVIFVPIDNNNDYEDFKRIPGVEIVVSQYFNMQNTNRNLFHALVYGRIHEIEQLMLKEKIDVIFEAATFFGWRIRIPVIAWIPDFQHRSLPYLFTKFSWLKREIGIRIQILSGRTIMLSSNDARIFCENLFPSTKGRTCTVHFSSQHDILTTFASARKIAGSYGLPYNFIYLPNQFWRHKNHKLVLDALSILKNRNIKVVIAASGMQYDPRFPNYFEELKRSIHTLDLFEYFLLLGVLPHDHVYALLLTCQSLLNPSLFEGWSTTVEEARAVGTPMLLSDLDVHFEQMGNEAKYFPRHSAKILANKLQEIPPYDPISREHASIMAKRISQRNLREFADNFAKLVVKVKRGY